MRYTRAFSVWKKASYFCREEEAKEDKEIEGTGKGAATQRKMGGGATCSLLGLGSVRRPLPPWRWGQKEKVGLKKLVGMGRGKEMEETIPKDPFSKRSEAGEYLDGLVS